MVNLQPYFMQLSLYYKRVVLINIVFNYLSAYENDKSVIGRKQVERSHMREVYNVCRED